MQNLLRFGVSIENDLLESFDRLIAERGYENRSEALRDMIRDALVQSRIETDNREVLGSLTLVYDHHANNLTEQMADIQHERHELVVSVMHAHVSHDDCLEMIMLRGKYLEVQALSNALLSLKGVKHGKLFVTLPANDIAKTRKSTKKHNHKHSHSHKHSHRENRSSSR